MRNGSKCFEKMVGTQPYFKVIWPNSLYLVFRFKKHRKRLRTIGLARGFRSLYGFWAVLSVKGREKSSNMIFMMTVQSVLIIALAYSELFTLAAVLQQEIRTFSGQN